MPSSIAACTASGETSRSGFSSRVQRIEPQHAAAPRRPDRASPTRRTRCASEAEPRCFSMSARSSGAASRMRASRSRSSRSTATMNSSRPSSAPAQSARRARLPACSGRRRRRVGGRCDPDTQKPATGRRRHRRARLPPRPSCRERSCDMRRARCNAPCPCLAAIVSLRSARFGCGYRHRARPAGHLAPRAARQGSPPADALSSSLDFRSMCASRGWIASCAISRPCAVINPCASSAPSVASKSRALASIAAGGGSSQRRAVASRAPQLARSSASGARSADAISGGVNAARLACAPSLHAR